MSSMSPYALVLGVLGAGAAAFAYKQGSHDMAHVESTVDGQRYIVRNMSDKQEAADRLAQLAALRPVVDAAVAWERVQGTVFETRRDAAEIISATADRLTEAVRAYQATKP